jgi:HD-like signal output (HDOD) protein
MQERAQLGYDHAVLGAHVLAHWKIPDPIPRIVAWHHQPNRAYADAKLARITACLRIADRIDAVLRVDPYHFEEHIDFIAEGVDCSVLGLKAQDLQSRAAMFFTLREDALELFGR